MNVPSIRSEIPLERRGQNSPKKEIYKVFLRNNVTTSCS